MLATIKRYEFKNFFVRASTFYSELNFKLKQRNLYRPLKSIFVEIILISIDFSDQY